MANQIKIREKNQKRSFSILFFTEIWERFGWYTLSSLFILYLTHSLGFTDAHSYSLYAIFTAMIFIMPPLGSYVADRYLNYHSSLITGLIILIAGYIMIAMQSMTSLYCGLATIIIGQGFFKTMPYLMVGEIYAHDKSKLDSRYTLYYLSINIGGIPALIFSGEIAKYWGYNYAFGVACIGMIIALATFCLFIAKLKPYIGKYNSTSIRNIILVLAGSAGIGVIVYYMMQHPGIVTPTIIAVTLALFVYICRAAKKMSQSEKKKLRYLIILIGFSVVFFTFWYQQPTSLTLFIDRNVDHHVFGINLPSSSFWVFNPFWILVVSPILLKIYRRINVKNNTLSNKLIAGLAFTAFSYAIIVFACKFFNHNGVISGYWIGLSYLFMAIGEMLISALGASMVIKFSPKSIQGVMMGVWFFASSVAGILAGNFANMTSVPKNNTNPMVSMHIYQHAFTIFGVVALIATIVAFFVFKRMSYNFDNEFIKTQNKLAGNQA